MKKNILLLALNFIFLLASAQRITLAIHQEYAIPDIPIITQLSDTLKSSSPIGNQWFKDGVELLGENKQKLVVEGSGNYKVNVTYDSGCSSESASFNAIKTDVTTIQTSEFTCKIFPNPNNGRFTIELESDKSGMFEFELFSSGGETILKQRIEHISGAQQIPFGKAALAKGVYYLQISYGTNVLSRKIIVN